MGAVVTIRSGKLEGRESHRVLSFRGIPYARAPVGPLRLRPPQPAEGWSGVRRADRFGPAAPQQSATIPLLRVLIGAGSGPDEDALSLNVWTPGPKGRRPVLVWIHGGAFVMGSGSTRMYAGSRLARRGDVVVVTLNYRLGALGFLNLREVWGGDAEAPSNLGLRDQIAALRWVRDNIEAFGGDPENVTVFGESAGGMSVGTLLGTPDASGLFHRAVAQSGAASNVSTQAHASEVAARFLDDLGARDRGGLERAPIGDVLRAQNETTRALMLGLGILTWQPSVDGDLLPDSALDAIAKGSARGVPTLVGTNRDEWKLFMLGDRKGRRMDEAGLRRRLERSGARLADRAVAVYTSSASNARDRWVAFQSDRVFHWPATRLAELQSEHAPVFSYLFSWAPPVLGACHGLEIPFVFGTLRDPLLRPFIGAAPSARRLSDRMQAAWLAFARTGDPATESLPDWSPYDTDRRRTLELRRAPRLLHDPHHRAHSFWRDLA